MKKYSILVHTVAVLFAALLITIGLYIPGLLLERQEADIIGLMRKQQINQKNPLSVSEVDPIPEIQRLSYDEFAWRIMLWKESDSTLSTREPYEDELTMEQASKQGVEELRELVHLGVIPKVDFDGLRLSSAALNTCVYPPTPQSDLNDEIGKYARWYMTYVSNGTVKREILISMDANDGRIYQIQIYFDDAEDIVEAMQMGSIAKAFAHYHGIDTKNGDSQAAPVPMQSTVVSAEGELLISAMASYTDTTHTMKVDVRSNTQ